MKGSRVYSAWTWLPCLFLYQYCTVFITIIVQLEVIGGEYRTKQRILNREISSGYELFKEMFNDFSYQGNESKKDSEIPSR